MGRWAKNCHVPYEVVLKNCAEQQVNAVEENGNEECDESNSSKIIFYYCHEKSRDCWQNLGNKRR